MVRVKVLFVLWSAFFSLSEAAVTLEVISGLSTDKTIECGEKDVIRCVVSPFPGTAGYMAWNTNSKSLTQCFDGSDNDCPTKAVDHYTFSSRLSDETFNLTFNSVKLSDSSVEFICTDIATTGSVTPNVAVVPDNASTTHTTSGLELEVTTGCVYPSSAVTFKWYYMKNGSPVVFDNSKSEETEDSTDCTTGDCGGQDVKKITSRLTTDSEGDEYNIHVDIIHSDVPENDPNYVVSKSFGMFKVAIIATTVETYDCPGLGNSTAVDSEVKCAGCWFGIGFAILLVVLYLNGIVLGCILKDTTCCCVCFYEGESCRKCAKYKCCYCGCCAPTPCGACCIIGGLPPWYKRLWASAIGIPIAFGIWVVWRYCRQGNNDTSRNAVGTRSNPKNAGTKLLDKKKPSKSPGKADDVNKEKHASVKQHQQDDQPQKNHLENEGKKAVRSQPPPPAGANPSREGTGSVVSRQDVEMHETDTSLNRSHLPNIHTPGHDNKGRGLSANFGDDDHPLVAIDIPAQKAGALPTIADTPKETKKKTKKKKKDKQEDNQKTETVLDF